MNAVAWAVAALSFVAYVIALQVGESCANQVGPWCAGAFFASWLWIGLRREWKDRK